MASKAVHLIKYPLRRLIPTYRGLLTPRRLAQPPSDFLTASILIFTPHVSPNSGAETESENTMQATQAGWTGVRQKNKKGWIHPSAVARNCNGPALISHPSARLRPSLRVRDRQTPRRQRRRHGGSTAAASTWSSQPTSVRARPVRKDVTWNQTHGTSSPSSSSASSSLPPSVSGQRQSYDMRFQPSLSHSSSRLLSLLCWCQKYR